MTYYDVPEYLSNSNTKTGRFFGNPEALEIGSQVDKYITEGVTPTHPIAIECCVSFNQSEIGELFYRAKETGKVYTQHEFYRTIEIRPGILAKVKCKPDIYIKGALQWDLKTTVCETEREFRAMANNLEYHRQMGLYRVIARVPINTLVVISKRKPYKVWFHRYTDQELDAGFNKFCTDVLNHFGLYHLI